MLETFADAMALVFSSYGDQPALQAHGSSFTFSDLETAAVELDRDRADLAEPTGHARVIRLSDDVLGVTALVAGWLSGDDLLLLPPGVDVMESALDAVALDVVGACPHTVWARSRAAGGRGDPWAIAGRSAEGSQLVVFMTSGTTGKPKFVVHCARTLLASLGLTLRVQAESLGITELVDELHGGLHARTLAGLRLGIRLMPGMPLSTIAGYTVLQRALLVGEEIVLSDYTDGRVFFDDMARFSPTSVSMPSVLARQVIRAARDSSVSATGVGMIGLGGGSVDPLIPEQLEAAFACIATVGYGSTELGGPALMARAGDAQQTRWSSVGAPLPGVDVRIGTAPSEGSLELRSPARALGYLHDDRFEAFDTDWLITGDLAETDGEGNVKILGRADGLILRGGRNVDPTSIERRIAQHEQVADVVVVGVPSRILGENDVAALIVPEDPARPPTLSEIRSWLAVSGSRLPSIQRLHVTAAIPRVRDGGPDLVRCRQAVDRRK